MWALLRHHRARRGILPADITPMAFGAVGDGVSDDRYAIQLAGRYCAEAGRPLVFEADRDYAFAGREWSERIPLDHYPGDSDARRRNATGGVSLRAFCGIAGGNDLSGSGGACRGRDPAGCVDAHHPHARDP